MKNLSTYTLEEQLHLINACLSRFDDFRHVIEENDKTLEHLNRRQELIIRELERRELIDESI